MSGLPLLGIYPMQLEDAIDTVKDVCSTHGIDEDELWQFIWQEMDELWNTEHGNHLSNQLVGVLFRNLTTSLAEGGIERERVDYYINGGLDTHFYIDGEEV